MSVVIGLSDIRAVLISKGGRSGAALADVCQGGYSIAKGFIITTDAFEGFLGNKNLAYAWSAYLDVCRKKKKTAEALELLRTAMSEARLQWDHEMEVIERFREMEGMVTVHLSTISGEAKSQVHAVTESGFMNSIKNLWAGWVESAALDELQSEFPALIVQEVIEAESSIEIKRKKDGFAVRAVFGQPEGLYDPGISSDHHHFDSKLSLTGSEKKEQKWQHVPTRAGVSKVEVMDDFQDEPKVAGEVLENLTGIMSYMLEKEEIEAITLMVIDDELIIDDVIALPIAEKMPLAIDQRKKIHHLIPEMAEVEPEIKEAPIPIQPVLETPAPIHQPALSDMTLRTKLFVKVVDMAQLSKLAAGPVDGVILLGKWYKPGEKFTRLGLDGILSELSRTFSSSKIVLQLPEDQNLQTEIIESARSLNPAYLLPPSRTLDQLHKERMRLASQTGRTTPEIWAQIVYPSNLFFFESMAADITTASVDLKKLALHLVGLGHEPAGMVKYDSHSIKEMVSHLMESAKKKRIKISVHSPNFAGLPSLLETVVRQRVDIICVSPEEHFIVKQIVGSVEKRMLQERS